jgi:hypothetical protein
MKGRLDFLEKESNPITPLKAEDENRNGSQRDMKHEKQLISQF